MLAAVTVLFKSMPICGGTEKAAMTISFGDEHAAELRPARGHVAGPADELRHSILIDCLTLATDGDEIAIAVRPEADVLRIQPPHVIRGRVVADTAVEHNVRLHATAVEFQCREASARELRITFAHHALLGLHRGDVH